MTPAGKWVLPALFLFAVVVALTVSVFKPHNTWDLVMYIAAAKSFEESDIDAVHAFTYNTLQHSVPEEVYLGMADRPGRKYGAFQQTMHADASAFKEQIPFYSIRPLYVGLIYLLYKTGMDIVPATYLISGVAVAAALALLYIMSASMLGRPLAYAVPFFAFIYGVTDIARASTPDGLAFLAVVSSAYLYLGRRITPLLILLPVMVCVRTDLILYSMPLLSVMLVVKKGFRMRAVASMAASVMLLLVIGLLSGNTGWSTVFYHTFIQLVTHPLSNPPVLTLHDYLRTLLYGIRNTLDDGIFVLYLLVAVCCSSLVIGRIKATSLPQALRTPSTALFMVCLISVLGRLVLFPVTWARYFAGPYMISTFVLLMMLAEHCGARPDESRQ